MPDILGLQKFKIVPMSSSHKKVNSNAAIISLMAVSAGVMVANIYDNQSILKEIRLSINASEAAVKEDIAEFEVLKT
jgi:hypothetical protein